jgi:endo-1,4-beta-xylanase
MRTAAAIVILVAGCVSSGQRHERPAEIAASAPASPAPPPASPAPPLRQAAARAGRHIGTACATGPMINDRYKIVVAREFDSLTPENEMKWESIERKAGAFSFGAGDRLVAFAAANGMRVRGHTLVWHSQLAPWVKGLSGAELRAAMIRHVQGVVGHFKGKIAQWDVVNEAVEDGSGGELRKDSPFTALGPTYLDEAFRAAHEADPDAQLFYNDYEIEGEGAPKTDGAFRLIKRLEESGVPINGVGFQMHVDPRHWPTVEQMRRNFERFAALGLAVEVTEMDVPVGEIPGTTADKLQRQKAIAHDIVAICMAVPRCSGITLWGFTDRYSWLADPHWAALRGRPPHLPLPFDAEYRPKPMVAGILDAFAGR